MPIVEAVEYEISTPKPGTKERKEAAAKKQEEQLKRLTQVIETEVNDEDLVDFQ